MIHLNHKTITLIAMIPLLFIFGTVNAAVTTNLPADTSSVQQKMETNAKATVLAKGQNNLPKHERTDCTA